MAQNYQQKRWFFTWQEVEGVPLPPVEVVQNLLSDTQYFEQDWVFQKERGEKAERLHYQGRFSLYKTRKTKSKILKEIAFNFGVDPKGLVLDWEKGTPIDSFAYCTKSETRVGGPWYPSFSIPYEGDDVKLKALYLWQQKIVSYLQSAPIDRHILWVYDQSGKSGKSTFVKYVDSQVKGVHSVSIPMTSVDRTISAVIDVASKYKGDRKPSTYFFDLPRRKGKEQDYGDLFSALEEIKNGYVRSAFRGEYRCEMFEPPKVVVFSNAGPAAHLQEDSLSFDRWLIYEIVDYDLIRKKVVFSQDKDIPPVQLFDEEDMNILDSDPVRAEFTKAGMDLIYSG